MMIPRSAATAMLRARALAVRHSIPGPVSTTRWFASASPERVTYDEDDYFSVLGVPYSFAMDENQLKTSYKKLMSEYHPDRHGSKSLKEQEELEHKASAVARAYDTLKRPHERATHLLEILGRPMEEASTGDLVGSEFLMNIMEIRSAVEYTEGDENLKGLLEENEKRIQANNEELAKAFEDRDLEKALELTARLQYFNRVDETIKEKMESYK